MKIGADSCPSLTVVMPTYNYGHYLKRAIDSVLEQTGAQFDLIIVDDGSTDDTREVIEPYRDRLTYIHKANQGAGAAVVTGVMRVPEDGYAVILDADDRLRPGFLNAVASMLSRDESINVVFTRLCDVSREGVARFRPVPRLDDDPLNNFSRFIHGRLPLTVGGAVIARTLFIRFFDLCRPFLTIRQKLPRKRDKSSISSNQHPFA